MLRTNLFGLPNQGTCFSTQSTATVLHENFFFFLVSMKTFFVFGHAQQLYSDGGQESSKQQIWATVKCGEVGLRLRIL